MRLRRTDTLRRLTVFKSMPTCATNILSNEIMWCIETVRKIEGQPTLYRSNADDEQNVRCSGHPEPPETILPLFVAPGHPEPSRKCSTRPLL